MFLRHQDIEGFPEWMPPTVRDEVVAEGMNRTSGSKSFGFWMLAFFLPAGIWAGLSWGAAGSSWWARIGMFVVLSALVEWPLITWQRRVFVRAIRGVLREKGVNVCTACAYSLDGVPKGSPCPECGADGGAMPPLGELVFGFVRSRGRVMCMKCGYDLVGLKELRACPECGGAIAGLKAEGVSRESGA